MKSLDWYSLKIQLVLLEINKNHATVIADKLDIRTLHLIITFRLGQCFGQKGALSKLFERAYTWKIIQ